MADPVDATADLLNSQGAQITPAPMGDPTADMLSANGATFVQPQAQRGALKSLLLNMARGAAVAGGYAVGIPQAENLNAEAATQRARLPYVGQLAQAQAQQATAEAAMNTQMTQPVTIQVPGQNGQMVNQTVPGWLARVIAPQNVRYLSAQNVASINADSRENVADKLHPQLAPLKEAMDALRSGDMQTYQSKLAQAQQIGAAAAGRNPVTPSMSRWVSTINDPNASEADKALAAKNVKLLQSLQEQQQEARGRSFAYNRGLYQWQTVVDPSSGAIVPMQGWQISAYQKQGVPVTASGRLSSKDQMAVQQLESEAKPAIDNVEKNLSAYDNPSDRAIFARVIDKAGKPTYGNEAGWMGTILNQALKENLSPQGQALTRDLARLNETVGRFRSVMGAPSTDTQMSLAMALLPGGSTPSSAYAREQLKNFRDMVELGTNIPLFKPGKGGAAPPAKPQSNSWFSGVPGAVPK